jgi:hypothetical protein
MIMRAFLKYTIQFIAFVFTVLLVIAIFPETKGIILLLGFGILVFFQFKHKVNQYEFFANGGSRSRNIPKQIKIDNSPIGSDISDGSDYKTVIETSKMLEAELTSKGANGKGLHEKATSIESILCADALQRIRKVATIRNKLIHEEDFTLSDRQLIEFKTYAREALNLIDDIPSAPPYSIQKLECEQCSSIEVPLITSKMNTPLFASCENCGAKIKFF